MCFFKFKISFNAVMVALHYFKICFIIDLPLLLYLFMALRKFSSTPYKFVPPQIFSIVQNKSHLTGFSLMSMSLNISIKQWQFFF